jgi:UDP-N-acetylglucosamine diphosphorylase/glucosamine-1-phosphate N-acetyltransferase
LTVGPSIDEYLNGLIAWGTVYMTSESKAVAIVILAAGRGTRMKSDKAKVLHPILGRPMILYVVATAQAVAGNNVVLVVGHQAEMVRKTVATQADVKYALQADQLGTGHAVMCALPALPEGVRHVVVLCGDVPMLGENTLQRFVDEHRLQHRALSVLAVHLDDPSGYGRIVHDRNGKITGIVEEADATPAQKTIQLVNTGIYCIERNFLETALQQISADNAQGEYYLTDIVSLANKAQLLIGVTVSENADEFVGINSREQLKAVEKLMCPNQG